MKRLIPAIAIALLTMGAYQAQPSQAQPSLAQPMQTLPQPDEAVCAGELPGDNDDQVVKMISCGVFQGMPCTGTSRPRCDLAPGEPAVCRCVNGFYECS
jgi:hypothetical protein